MGTNVIFLVTFRVNHKSDKHEHGLPWLCKRPFVMKSMYLIRFHLLCLKIERTPRSQSVANVRIPLKISAEICCLWFSKLKFIKSYFVTIVERILRHFYSKKILIRQPFFRCSIPKHFPHYDALGCAAVICVKYCSYFNISLQFSEAGFIETV